MHAASYSPRREPDIASERGDVEAPVRRRGAASGLPTWAGAEGLELPAALFEPEPISAAVSTAADTPSGAPIVAPAGWPGRGALALPLAAPPGVPREPPNFTVPGVSARASGWLIQRAPANDDNGSTPGGEAMNEPGAAEPGDGAAMLPQNLIVEDDALPGPNQMRKSEFMSAVHDAVCRAVDEELAGTPYSSRGCPYVEFWLGFYSRRDAAQIERGLRRYAPDTRTATSATRCITLIGDRVRRAAQTWRNTGLVTGVPEGIPASLAAPWPAPARETERSTETAPVAAIPVDGASAASVSSQTVRRQLGPGQPLEGGVRARMEPTLGADLSRVRVHTDPSAAGLSHSLRARAFAVGEHVAFGAGQYRPGTPLGDALLAHELAHTIQQGGSDTAGEPAADGHASHDAGQYASLERDADRSALGIVAQLWAQATDVLRTLSRQVAPALRTGLRLQRCGESDSSTPAPTATTATPPPPPPLDVLRGEIRPMLSDNRLTAAELQTIRRRTTELALDESDVRQTLSRDFSFDTPASDLAGLLAFTDNPTLELFRQSYSFTISSTPDRALQSDPVRPLVTQVMADSRIDAPELDALRRFCFIFDESRVSAELQSAHVVEPTLGQLRRIFGLSGFEFPRFLGRASNFPITLAPGQGGSLAAGDLRLSILLASNTWRHADLALVRTAVRGMTVAAATAFFTNARIAPPSAALLAREFTRPDREYNEQVERLTLLTISFRTTQPGEAELTPETQQNLGLSYLAAAVGPWRPPLQATTNYVSGSMRPIGDYRFDSGLTLPATRLQIDHGGHIIDVITSTTLANNVLFLIPVIFTALSNVPARHAALIRELILDPGNDPHGFAGATAAAGGRVNIYFSNAGTSASQSDINRTAVHETGHLVSFSAAGRDATFWTRWEAAMRGDQVAISRYGLSNRMEDFAEAYVVYLTGGNTDTTLRQRYAQRWAILATLF